MQLKETYITHEIGDTHVLLPIGDSTSDFCGVINLNETAAFIVNCLRRNTTEEAIAAALLAEYDVSPETAAADVRAMLQKLRNIHAINE